jgi:UDP-N-acetylglucosamine--N-acetylmuramyl-(pentapeptide) pyrophosphoryl-undecaprenol N-acetylglucosamine transferase
LEQPLRLMIAAGGTGGHVYPALAAAEAMIAQFPETQLIFVGTVGGFERPLLDQSRLPFVARHEVQAGPIHGVNPLRALGSAFKLLHGTVQAYGLLRRHRPHVILSTGGWVGFPVSLAARLRGVPLLIYLPDIEPGLTIKVLRFFASQVAVTAPDSQQYFRQGQTVVTGYPLRREVMAQVGQRDSAITHFGLDPNRKTLLVFGGSKGSRAVNIGVIDILPAILADGHQVIHVTGTLDEDRSREQVASLGNIPNLEHYHAYPYLHGDMALAFAAADLAICRAGASILGEFPAFGLPSVLIPLAYSWRYQQVNADYLAARGAAVHLDETRMAQDLLPTVRGLLNDEARLNAMKSAVKALAQSANVAHNQAAHNGAANLARALEQLARGSS